MLDLRTFVTPEQQQQVADAAGESGSSGSSREGGAIAAASTPAGGGDAASGTEEPPSPGRALGGEVEMRSIGVVPTGGQGSGSEGSGEEGRSGGVSVSVSGGGSSSVSGSGGGGGAPSIEGEGDGPCAIVRSGSLLYDLYAVLLHAGQLEKGHYFALIKDVEDGSWYRFDDEKVTLLTPEQLDRELRKAYGGRGSTSAYMLLYREVAAGGDLAASAAGSADGASEHAGDDPAAAAFTSTL